MTLCGCFTVMFIKPFFFLLRLQQSPHVQTWLSLCAIRRNTEALKQNFSPGLTQMLTALMKDGKRKKNHQIQKWGLNATEEKDVSVAHPWISSKTCVYERVTNIQLVVAVLMLWPLELMVTHRTAESNRHPLIGGPEPNHSCAGKLCFITAAVSEFTHYFPVSALYTVFAIL